MPSVCDCPYCGQPTAIPEDLESDTVVRCPLCQYEFHGDRALMYAVEAPPEHIVELPPPLVAVRTAEDAATAVEPAGMQEPAPQDGTDVGATTDAGIQEPVKGIEPSPAAAGEVTTAAPILPAAATEASPASETSDVNTVQPAPPVEQKPPEAAESSPAPVSSKTTPPPSFCQPSFCQTSPAWRERRNRNPIRTAIGIVISGLLGLAVPYGAWLGLSKLGFWGSAKPAAAETESSGSETKSAKPESKETPPPDPKSFDEWPGLDENRFTGAPKEVPKNVQPSRPAKKGSSGSGQF